MRFTVRAALGLTLAVALLRPGPAQAANPEDAPIPDVDVKGNQNTLAPAAQPTAQPGAQGEMIMVPRAVWEQLLRDVEGLKRQRGTAPETETPPPVETTPMTGNAEPGTGKRNYLLLPDISLILQAKGIATSDKRDAERGKLKLAEGELGIQGYLYPNVKADAFLTAAPGEDEAAQFEEGYVTFIGLRKGLNLNVGRKFAPFGRTGELHNHSWLYPRQLLPIQNLVSPEALTGDGVNLHYTLPAKGKLFARASLGAFSGQGTETQVNHSDPTDPFFGGVPAGPGAGYTDRFYNARLWMGYPTSEHSELDWGVSHARGNSAIGDDMGHTATGRVNLTGADISYRRFLPGGRRVLLRSEYFKHQPHGLFTSNASGYYGLANYRFSKFNDAGLLYERSGFPQAPGEHENAWSLIYTKQFTEQFYARLMGTHGSRPGDEGYNELRFQLTAGLGPHTHNLE